jgi:hypothetical protein
MNKYNCIIKNLIILICFTSIASLLNIHGADIRGGYHIRFGILESDKSGNYFLSKETTIIPRKLKETGFRFGYEIVPLDHTPYICQYIIHLPSSPDTITGGLAQVNPWKPSTTISSHKKEISGPYIDPMWFDPGDPAGDCSIDIIVNEKPLKKIKFRVHEN